ncbi:MAG: type II/IV secretion system ATPase subunit [Methanomicrobiales archaeon]|nr:type II/IV secretion system ATPase subunit [Methanomicrobiales archaeon]
MSATVNEPDTIPSQKPDNPVEIEIELPSLSDIKSFFGRLFRKRREIDLIPYDDAESIEGNLFSQEGAQSPPDYGEDSMEMLVDEHHDMTSPKPFGVSSFFDSFRGKTIKDIPLYDVHVHGPLTEVTLPTHYQIRREYWVREGCSKTVIAYNRKTMFNEYLVYEPSLSEFEHELLERLYIDLRDVLLLSDEELDEDRRQLIMDKVYELIRGYGISLSKHSLFKIEYYLSRNYLHWGRLTPLMEDPYIEDISCDGNDIPLYLFHITETNIKTNISFTEDALLSLAFKLAQRTGKHISSASPIVDATLSDGSRLQLTLGKEVTARGTSFTIRKFRAEPFTPIDLLNVGTFQANQLAYFWLAVENNKNLLFIGGTASGKTTSLNAVSVFIPPLKKIITIEDTREIALSHENWIASITRDTVSDVDTGIGMFVLLKAALRQRPEYIIVGEVRGEEAQTLFQAMNIGHTTFSTMHAGGVDAAIYRLENPPLNVPRNMLQSLDIITIQKQVEINGKNERRVDEIVEVAGIDPSTGNVLINSVFEYDPMTDSAKYTGRSHVLPHIAKAHGFTAKQMNKLLWEREQVLLAMQKQKINGYFSVSKIIYVYYANRNLVMKNINNLSMFLV